MSIVLFPSVPLPVDAGTGMSFTNLGPDIVYYGSHQSVSSTSNDGSIAVGTTLATAGIIYLVLAPTASQAHLEVSGTAAALTPGSVGVILPWVSGSFYLQGETVTNGRNTYTANDTHQAGATFTGDLSAHWTALPIAAITTGGQIQIQTARPTQSSQSWEWLQADAAGLPTGHEEIYSYVTLGTPVVLTAPVITGFPVVGATLACSTGTWTNAPAATTYAYQWSAGGVAVGGATSSTYVIRSADAGKVITCAVTPNNGDSAGTPSTATMPVNTYATVQAATNIPIADSFTGTVGTLLSAHTSDIGATWTHNAVTTGTMVLSSAGRIYLISGGLDGGYTSSQATANQNYAVTADLVFLGYTRDLMSAGAGADFMSIGGRMLSAFNTGYFAQVNLADGGINLVRTVANVQTVLGSYTPAGPFTGGRVLTITLQVTDAAKNVVINGSTVITSADNTITAAGFAGVKGSSTLGMTDGGGLHVDNLAVLNL